MMNTRMFVSETTKFQLSEEEFASLPELKPGVSSILVKWLYKGKYYAIKQNSHEVKINKILKEITHLPTILYAEDFISIGEDGFITPWIDKNIPMESLTILERQLVLDILLETILHLHKTIKFVHGDINETNFFIVKTDEPIKIEDKEFKSKYKPLLFDFEFTGLEYKGEIITRFVRHLDINHDIVRINGLRELYLK